MTVAILLGCVCVYDNCMFKWQYFSSLYCNGNPLKQVDGCLSGRLSLMHIVCYFFYQVHRLLILCSGRFDGNWEKIALCVWRQVPGVLCISSPFHESLHCGLHVPWIVDETLNACLKLERPTSDLLTRGLRWLHPAVCPLAARVQSVLCM